MDHLIEDYLSGPQSLRDAVAGLTPDQLHARPFPGQWSICQVVCHVADCELVYADRIKRILVEENPCMQNLAPDAFAAALAYEHRDVEEELQLFAAVRKHLGRILLAIGPDCLQRAGDHSIEGPLTLETLLHRSVDHLSHHVRFIRQKRAVMAADEMVDEASEESFPASDSPAWTGVTGP